MMEYPEVVCMRDHMRESLIGKRIARVFAEDESKYADTVRGTLFTQPPEMFRQGLEGSTVAGVENVSQTLFIAVDTGRTLSFGAVYGSIRFHPTENTLPKRKRPCLQLDFSDGTYLTVVISLFGGIRIFDGAEKAAYLANREERIVTPDSERFALDGFRAALAEERIAKVNAKKLLTSRMPVYYVDGLGGGYVNEILYRAKIHPKRKVSSLTPDEQEAYYMAIKEVTAEAIEQGGRYTEKSLYGQPGGFVPHVCRDTLGHPCQVCGTTIVKFQFQGGACYVCPGCQPPTSPTHDALERR